jgi:hypothetical protein
VLMRDIPSAPAPLGLMAKRSTKSSTSQSALWPEYRSHLWADCHGPLYYLYTCTPVDIMTVTNARHFSSKKKETLE